MKEFDPENGTYKNVEIDPKTQEVRYGECSPNEEKVFYRFHKINKLHHKWWFWCLCALVLIAPWLVLNITHQAAEEVITKKDTEIIKSIDSLETKLNLDTIIVDNANLTIKDSSQCGAAYTDIKDTSFNGFDLHIYNVRYGIPELYVCDSTDLDINDVNIVFAARAADIGKKREVLGFFINQGEILATGSSKKEGFCAIINNNITLGAGKTTPFLEEAINKKGYFFRNPPLVVEGIALERNDNKRDVRRALCSYKNEIVYIRCDTQMTLTQFAELLSDFGVETAINMVGSRGGHGFCRDENGKLKTWGKNKYYKNNYKGVSYLIWKNE